MREDYRYGFIFWVFFFEEFLLLDIVFYEF